MQFLDIVRIKSGDYSRYGYKIGDKGVLRYIYEEKDIVYRFEADKKGLAASVRCVRDAEQ